MAETPGSRAIENLKTLENAVAEFKKPSADAVRKKGKPKILTEEKYIEASRIL